MRFLLCGLAICLTGCAVGPTFSPPKSPEVANWKDKSVRTAKTVTEQANPDPRWWNGFGDPMLTKLMQQAISGNLDLQQAVFRVLEAHQGEITARAGLLPQVNSTDSYMREQLGLRGLLLSEGTNGQVSSLANPGSTLNQVSPGLGNKASSAIGGALTQFEAPVNLFSYGLSSSWELDLFGRVRRSREQAGAQTQAQIEATNDALVMLEGQVAQAYAQLRGGQVLSNTQQENVRTSQSALQLTQQQQRRGLATDLDVEQARTQLASAEAQLPGYQKQTEQAMNRLSVLIGQPPGAVDAMLSPSAPLPRIPAVVGIGVPSTLTRRRPDVREAEANLHAATANVGIAVASFYPDVSLTGSFGLRALDAAYLTNWASAFYSFGPSISLPIFQGGRLTANLRLARAQEAASALAYRGTVLNALREVEDALVAYRTDQAQRDKLAVAVHSGELTLYLARNAVSQPLENFIQVLDAERTLTGARQQLAQADVTLVNDVVSLYDALGGGWQDDVNGIPASPIDPALPPVPAALDSVAAQ